MLRGTFEFNFFQFFKIFSMYLHVHTLALIFIPYLELINVFSPISGKGTTVTWRNPSVKLLPFAKSKTSKSEPAQPVKTCLSFVPCSVIRLGETSPFGRIFLSLGAFFSE
jgi:hypothetical protein